MKVEFINELNTYLTNRYNYKKKLVSEGLANNTLTVSRKRVELYIRFMQNQGSWDNNTVVIARIRFNEKRQGNGTDLLRFLVDKSLKYGFNKVGIECAETPDIIGLVKKFGFESYTGNDNWVINASELEDRLRCIN